MIRTILIATMVAAVALAQQAKVNYQVNPAGTEGSDPTFIPTCSPTVISSNAAFICYMNTSGAAGAQFVSPSMPRTQYLNSRIAAAENTVITESPIAIGPVQAVVAVSDIEDSFWAMISSSQVLTSHDRQHSTAPVEYSFGLKTLYVPIGQHVRTGHEDSINAYDITAADEKDSIAWSARFNLPDGFNGSTAIQSPTAYDGVLYIIQDDVLYALNGTKDTSVNNQVLWSVKNPCGIVPAKGYFIQMKVVTFGSDANGPLDAFILYANTTKEGAEGLAVCRISHHSHKSEWAFGSHVMLNRDFFVHDVVGGKDVLFISGRFTNGVAYDDSYAIIAFDIHSGDQKYAIKRSSMDHSSFPAMLNIPIPGCNGTFVAQVRGRLTAYCSERGPNGQKWMSNMGCSHTPLVIKPSKTSTADGIICTDTMKSVHMINAQTGNMEWINAIKAIYSPKYADQLVWVVDLDSTLYGLNPTDIVQPTPAPVTPVPTAVPGAPPTPAPQTPTPQTNTPVPVPTNTPKPAGPNPAPAPSKKSNAGVVVVIVLLVLSVAIGAPAGYWYWKRREARRGPYQASLDSDGGYGSLSS